jgi:hypothetical protein
MNGVAPGKCFRCHSSFRVTEVRPGLFSCSGFCRKYIPDSEEVKVMEWKVGDFCRAVDRDDGFEYEGTLLTVESCEDGQYGNVCLVGYGTEKSYWFHELKPSAGEAARAEQEAAAANVQEEEDVATPSNDLTMAVLTSTNKMADLTIAAAVQERNDHHSVADLTIAHAVGEKAAASTTNPALNHGSAPVQRDNNTESDANVEALKIELRETKDKCDKMERFIEEKKAGEQRFLEDKRLAEKQLKHQVRVTSLKLVNTLVLTCCLFR